MHVYNLCRICLTETTSTKGMQPLFEENNALCSELVQKIEECGGIVLKPHEEFPKMICSQCLESLDVSYKFRTMCQTSEHALLDAIVKSEMKIEPNDNTIHTETTSNTESETQNDVFFGLRTEFIDAEEVDLTDLAGDTKDSYEHDTNPEDDEKSLPDIIDESSDSDFEVRAKLKVKRKIVNKLPTSRKSNRRVPLTNKSTSKNKKPRGRPRRLKLELPQSNIMCEICGNIYAKRSILNLHMRRHMAEKPFECEICGKTFACPSEISRHIRVHTGEKPFVCKYCGRTFADRSTNIKHERIHTNERPFTCKTCGKSFTYSNVLKNHMLTHTGEKPFPCIPCNKTFSRKHQLDQHFNTLTHQQTVKNLGVKSEDDGLHTQQMLTKTEDLLS